MHLATNKDIWIEILEYFRVSLSSDNADDLKDKRHTIISIALVCPELVDVALDELWRSLTTLEPIVRVFNAPFATDALEFRVYGDYWVVLPGKITTGLKARLTDYLSRIKYLLFSTNPYSRECALWQTLFSFGFTPLCPNLRGISLAGMNIPSQAYNLTAFATSSLQSITLQADTASGEIASSMVLDALNYRGMRMLDITYTGYTTDNVLSCIFRFSELRSVTIRMTQYQGGLLETSDIQSFGTMAHLTSLALSLDMFRMASHVGRWIENMEQLSVLSLHGKWSTVCGCMQDRTFPAVKSLSLTLQPSTSLPRRSSLAARPAPSNLSTIFKAFPSLHSLCLINEGNKNLTDLVISPADISTMNGRPLRCLEFRYIMLPFTNEDIINIMQTWPTLERLSIIPNSKDHRPLYSAYKLLSYASHGAPRLHDLILPLDLSSLIPSYSTSVGSSCKCPLLRLELSQAQNLPQDLKGKHALARNLVSFFPRLRVVTSVSSDVGDLQMIVELLQDVISSPPSRPDGLF